MWLIDGYLGILWSLWGPGHWCLLHPSPLINLSFLWRRKSADNVIRRGEKDITNQTDVWQFDRTSSWNLTLFSRISRPAWSPPTTNTPCGSPCTWRALGPWCTRFPRGPHRLLNRSRLPTYLINEHIQLQHLLWKTGKTQLSTKKSIWSFELQSFYMQMTSL